MTNLSGIMIIQIYFYFILFFFYHLLWLESSIIVKVNSSLFFNWTVEDGKNSVGVMYYPLYTVLIQQHPQTNRNSSAFNWWLYIKQYKFMQKPKQSCYITSALDAVEVKLDHTHTHNNQKLNLFWLLMYHLPLEIVWNNTSIHLCYLIHQNWNFLLWSCLKTAVKPNCLSTFWRRMMENNKCWSYCSWL